LDGTRKNIYSIYSMYPEIYDKSATGFKIKLYIARPTRSYFLRNRNKRKSYPTYLECFIKEI